MDEKKGTMALRAHLTANAPTSSLSRESDRVVAREEWIAGRQTRAHDKELTRLRDRSAHERRTLPWVRIAMSMCSTRLRVGARSPSRLKAAGRPSGSLASKTSQLSP